MSLPANPESLHVDEMSGIMHFVWGGEGGVATFDLDEMYIVWGGGGGGRGSNGNVRCWRDARHHVRCLGGGGGGGVVTFDVDEMQGITYTLFGGGREGGGGGGAGKGSNVQCWQDSRHHVRSMRKSERLINFFCSLTWACVWQMSCFPLPFCHFAFTNARRLSGVLPSSFFNGIYHYWKYVCSRALSKWKCILVTALLDWWHVSQPSELRQLARWCDAQPERGR